METAAIIAIAAVGLSAVGIGTTIIVLLLRGSFMLGGSINQVNNLGKQVESLTAQVNELRAESQQTTQQLRKEMVAGQNQLMDAVNDLRAEVQLSNQMLAALANHTHDTDRLTVFTVPTVPSR